MTEGRYQEENQELTFYEIVMTGLSGVFFMTLLFIMALVFLRAV